MEKQNQLKHMMAQQRWREAEMIANEIIRGNPDNVDAYQALAQLYVQQSRYEHAISALRYLIKLHPHIRAYHDGLAQILTLLNRNNAAADTYATYIRYVAEDSEGHFNYAYYLKQAGQFKLAIDHYKQALSLDIRQPEEVWLNIGVIYSDNLLDTDMAKQAFSYALNINPVYSSALYNLANLEEQSGNRQAALTLFEQVAEGHPNYISARARILDIKQYSQPSDPDIVTLQRLTSQQNLSPIEAADAYFALGKALDNCHDYQQAFAYYLKANQIVKRLQPAYQPKLVESYITQIIEIFDGAWLRDHSTDDTFMPVFICGMFRSGSTLTEQILGAHDEIDAGGELDFWPRALGSSPEWLERFANMGSKDALIQLGNDYKEYIAERFSGTQLITDKRVDNLFYMGLLKAVFPNAKFIFTARNPLDNGLSVYFHHLGNSMNYASDMTHIGHFYMQHMRLIKHWRELFSDSIFTVQYEDLVNQPKQVIQPLLTFLAKTWQPQCLDFYRQKNVVKTASVWQVRRPLYGDSIERWRHYQDFIHPLRQALSFKE